MGKGPDIMMIDIVIPPGIVKTGAKRLSAGRWQDGNLVRWHEGVCQPIGGAEMYADGVIGGPQSRVPAQNKISDGNSFASVFAPAFGEAFA